MKKLFAFLVVVGMSTGLWAQDTFSIIAVDPATGEVGSAGASCVTGVGSSGIIDIITDIIPGRGGVNSQAYVCIPNVNLQNAINEMENGASPQEIIDYLLANDACSSQSFDPQYRQYGIVDLDPATGDPRTAGFTGNMADDYKEDRQGATYSIQGNILLFQEVIDNMENNFNTTTGTLADKLMAAMQGANIPGADSRCLGAGTSSTTAYLIVYKADDEPGNPYLRLNVGQQASGTEPIDILQDLYDDFLTTEDFALQNSITLYPNPTEDVLHLQTATSLVLKEYTLYDLQGKHLGMDTFSPSAPTVNVSGLASGLYFLKVSTSEGTIMLRFVKQ